MVGPAFVCFGGMPPASPVVLSVPHAGRDYPAALAGMLRVPLAALRPLEDRHVDAVAHGARRDEAMIVQTRARAWIDLNRDEAERDPKVDDGAVRVVAAAQSAKIRSGLGLVPGRVSGAGQLWRRRFSDADVTARIVDDHRPYHAALAAMLAAAQARFGIAILLDLHSMPPLAPCGARIVLGDRFGTACDPRFVARMETEAAAMGLSTALNAPYAGGHILERHARPATGIHGIQLEIDRSLYLDAGMDRPGGRVDATVTLVRRMIDALEDEAIGLPRVLAAE